MLKNYLKVAFRTFYKSRGYSFINILGLSVAVCACILIILFVRSEFSYDRFHSKSDRLYRAWLVEKQPDREDFVSTITCLPLGAALSSNVSGVEKTCRVYAFNTLATHRGQTFNEPVHLVDSTFFEMFDFRLLKGNIKKPWTNPNSVIISDEVARKYFQHDDPIGKTIELQLDEKQLVFSVSGVVQSVPDESSIKVDFLLPFSNEPYLFNARMSSSVWNVFTETYVLLKKNSDVAAIHKRIARMIPAFLGDQPSPGSYNIYLQPISHIHLDSSLPKGIEATSDTHYSYIVSTAAVFLLISACLNFIILSIARSTSRSREVGIRKVLGARKGEIQFQFFGEALLLASLSLILGLLLALIFFKPFSRLIGKDLTLNLDIYFWSSCAAVGLVTTILIGLYPSLLFSRFKPSEVLNGKIKFGTRGAFFRQSLIILQLTIAIVMTISALIIFKQLHFIRSRDPGYNKKNIVIVSTNQKPDIGFRTATLFQNVLSGTSFVESVTIGMYALNEAPWPRMGFTDATSHTARSFQFNAVDAKFLPTMGLHLVAGQNFLSDSDQNLLVNETLVKQYGWQNAVGKMLPGPFPQRIGGVVRDFNIESLHTPVKPLVLATRFDAIASKAETMLFPAAMKPRISIRLRPGSLTEQIQELQARWKTISPDQTFDYSTLDESLLNQYRQDDRVGAILNRATALSLFISCIGLFGLVTFTIARRTKEIAVRKVLGAGVPAIVRLITREFAFSIFIASFLSFPIAFMAMSHWLADFAYRIKITPIIFIESFALVLIISFATIFIQTLKASIANPTKSIRVQ